MPEQRLDITVIWSHGNPRHITLTHDMHGNLNCYCTCVAGKHGQYCKHRFKLLEGDTTDILSDNAGDYDSVDWWYWSKGIQYGFIWSGDDRCDTSTYTFDPIGKVTDETRAQAEQHKQLIARERESCGLVNP